MPDVDMNVTLEQLNERQAFGDLLPALITMIVMMPIGIIGNSLVLYVFKTKMKASNHRWLILCIAVVDMIACTVGLPLQIMHVRLPYMYYAVPLCKFMYSLLAVIILGPAFMFVLVAVERYLKICRPFGRQLSIKQVRWLTLVVAIASTTFAIQSAIVNGYSTVETGVINITGVECWTDDNFKETYYHVSYYTLFFLALCGCTISLAVLYSLIARKICQHGYVEAAIKIQRTAHAFPGKRSTTATGSTATSVSGGRSADVSVADTDGENTTDNDLSSAEILDSSKPCKMKKTGSIRRRTIRLTVMLFIVTVVSFLSFMPTLTVRVVFGFRPDLEANMDNNGKMIMSLFYRTFFINNIANPIIYIICDQKFRRESLNIFRRH